MTASDLIASAYRLVGVLAVGQTMSGDRAVVGLEALNQLIDQWNIEGTTLFTVSTAVINTAAGDATYTIGPTGDIVVSTRPASLVSAAYRDNSTTPPIDYPLTIIGAADYNLIADKQSTNSQSFFLYYEPSFPNGTITLFQVPSIARQLVVQYLQPLDSNLTLASVINLPPAYHRALRFNLAVALAVEAGRQQVNPGVVAIANESKTLLESANFRVPLLAYNIGGGDYDINVDFVR